MEEISLSKDFTQDKGIRSYKILEKFESKKNDVYRIRCIYKKGSFSDLVLKKYRGRNWQQRLKKEYLVLKSLQDRKILVPESCFKGRNFLILQYIKGRTFLDFIEEYEEKKKELSENLIYGLCKYIYMFNKEAKEVFGKSLILQDINLKNFIVNGDKIFKVDFEECRNGVAEEDGGRLCAFLLTYRPEFSGWKLNLWGKIFKTLRDDFKLDSKKMKKEMFKEFKIMEKRRNMSFLEKTEKLLEEWIF